MKSIINKLNLEVTYKGNGKIVTIVPNNFDTHTKIIEILRNENAEFQTYSRKSDIKPKILLKGLPMLPVEVIANELQSYNLKIISIYMLRNKNNINPNLATYLITVENLTILKELLKIKYISSIVIEWEKFLKRQRTTQCFNCQKFGHGEINCHHVTACMKCADNHDTKTCSINDKVIIKCHNCSENHMASDIKCPV